MKKLILTIFILGIKNIYAQCPEGDIQFTTQAEVNDFAVEYPHCTHINGIMRIGYHSQSDITDLTPLNNIRTVGSEENFGGIVIQKTSLSNLEGLNNLESVNGSLEILMNDNIVNLEGLNSLEETTMLFVQMNEHLESLNGLHALTSINNELTISHNSSLGDLQGLENLVNVIDFSGGSVNIHDNDSLESLIGLDNLQSIGGNIVLYSNPNLITLSSLGTLTSINGNLKISENNSLSSLNGLNNLEFINGSLQISNNPNLVEITALEKLTFLPYGLTISNNQILESLQGLNNITKIGYIIPPEEGMGTVGDLYIDNNPSLPDLSGLNALVEVWRDVQINYNNLLQSMDGLQSLTTVGAGLSIIGNVELNTLEGLQNVTGIGIADTEGFYDDMLWIESNPFLSSISELENLVTLTGGRIRIVNNAELNSLEGIQNINPETINYLELMSSQNLSVCSVPSICNYLSAGGEHVISGNASGCLSAEEIIDICRLSVEEINSINEITLYPVPTQSVLNIAIKNGTVINSIEVYDLNGRMIYNTIGNSTQINISHLSAGTYLVSVKTSKGIHNEKIIKK